MNNKLLFTLFFSFILGLNAQSTQNIIKNYLDKNQNRLELSQDDYSNFKTVSDYTTSKTGLQHVIIQQRINGIPVFNGVATVTIKGKDVVYFGNRFQSKLSQTVNTENAAFNNAQAVNKALSGLGLGNASNLEVIETPSEGITYRDANVSLEDITVKLVYQPIKTGDLRLAYDLGIYTLDAQHYWSVRIDAVTGNIISQQDQVISCDFGSSPEGGNIQNTFETHIQKASGFGYTKNTMLADGSQYLVFPEPIETPNHGSPQVVSEPADPVASPFGWHDTDGVDGVEFTTTRGNNAYAIDDRNDDNIPNGIVLDGGAALDFTGYSTNTDLNPLATTNFALSNLFYWNNLMHDVWYQYGFDEASGNYQENNYGNGGAGSDSVNAEAQDGNRLNNANFFPNVDGGNSRMQMFLWGATGAVGNPLTVNSPASISGSYQAAEPIYFGSGLTDTALIADIVLADDGSGTDVNDGCEAISNTAELNGNIAIIRRGICPFVDKVKNAQDAGAIAAIIVNNVPNEGVLNMAGADNTITIPSVFLSLEDGDPIITELEAGETVTSELLSQPAQRRDGDFDNGIISHEYGHGISTRLTGGPLNSNCLGNDEQMGEGWSDWFGLMLTIEPGDTGADVRGIGTYVNGQPTSGSGIRNAPYSTDFAVNDFTYADTNNPQFSIPHGIGSVWSAMLWDMAWALIDQYGFDPDLYNGTGGNNIAMQLVIDGLKMQPCSPGFIDGRDAILAADMATNGGANQCLIYQAFANRGLGFSASQGSSSSRSDQTEAFDLPPSGQLDCSTLSIDENSLQGLNIYPNPANNILNISLPNTLSGMAKAKIIDLNGRTVLESNLDLSSTMRLDISGLANGIYMFEITTNNSALSKKLIIN